MTQEILQQYWAILAASVIGFAVVLVLAAQAVLGSAPMRLNARVGELRKCEKAAARASRALARASGKLERLQRRERSVKPRLIEEAVGELEDAKALQKIAHDQLLIARNQVRKIIVEEFPPKRHEAMRKRLLPDEKRESRPFSMEGG